MTDQDLRNILAELAKAQTDTQLNMAETQREIAETNRSLRETARDLRKQMGDLGQKFGFFTEGMAFPSMQKLLSERFGMRVIAPRVIARQGSRTLELDVLAYSDEAVFVVEVKSHLREDGLDQMRRILRDVREFFPNHAGKKLYGILAAVDFPADIEARVLREGLYLARVHDEEFELVVPDGFHPRSF